MKLEAHKVIDADGCLGVASSPGGSTFGQPSVYYPLIMPYTQCCSGCGIYDADTDGICDDSDNCTDKTALNYADPANGSCSTLVVEGCTDPAYTEYDASANTDDGSCSTLVVEGCTDPAYTEYNDSANTGRRQLLGHWLRRALRLRWTDNTYGVVEIGDQCWFAENLRTTVYADGSAIPEVTDNTAWSGLSTGARCDYDNDASNVATYGRMYNWYAASDAAELCPTGWHVPTDEEWTALETYVGANGHSGAEGAALKSTSGWNNSGNGTDDFGFSALPGGYRVFRWLLLQCRGLRQLVEFFAQWRQCLVSSLDQRQSRHPPVPRRSSVRLLQSGVLGMPIERSEGGLTL